MGYFLYAVIFFTDYGILSSLHLYAIRCITVTRMSLSWRSPGLDCETYCVTVSHVIPLNVTAPLSYRILILLLKEFSTLP